MILTSVQLHWMWQETDNYLSSLAQCVREGKRVQEAANYCRWLQFSGVIELLEGSPQPFPLMVDGQGTRRKLRDLIQECGELFKGGKHDAKYVASDIAEINRKLDVLTAHLASPVQVVTDELRIAS